MITLDGGSCIPHSVASYLVGGSPFFPHENGDAFGSLDCSAHLRILYEDGIDKNVWNVMRGYVYNPTQFTSFRKNKILFLSVTVEVFHGAIFLFLFHLLTPTGSVSAQISLTAIYRGCSLAVLTMLIAVFVIRKII